MLAACLCCRKKVPKNELLGLEGMVKIKNPDEHISIANGVAEISIDPNSNGGTTHEDRNNEKRISNAPHRSLPDIPVSDPIAAGGGAAGDTGSELYATVGDKSANDKFTADRQQHNAIRKLASISQHSSISQADDVSSPYARVKLPANHAYDQLRITEHPYAQVTAVSHGNQPNTVSNVVVGLNRTTSSAGTSSNAHNNTSGTSSNEPTNGDDSSTVDGPSRRGSNESLLGGNTSHEDIPAASAIAGRVSASQELPYMTPPIVQQPNHHTQHFSGDSQDSSKGYTSISVREPLANIIAQTNQQNAAQNRRRDLADSHYATVSDDSDEMYAAIEDPNQHHVDLYTSGSETYAQIQLPPNSNSITIAVEINNEAPVVANAATAPLARHQVVEEDVIINVPSAVATKRQSVISAPIDDSPIPSHVDNLRTVHSRQASSSSCTSSVGNLGSPKPEKRQANSPLPPTPKNSTTGTSSLAHTSSGNGAAASMSNPSNRNSVASVFESQLAASNHSSSRHVSRENLTSVLDGSTAPSSRNSVSLGSQLRLSVGDGSKLDEDAAKKRNSAKNLEGMYAKVMKKNKLSNAPSPNTSPIAYRKSYNDDAVSSAFVGSHPDIGAALNSAHDPDAPASIASNLSKSMISPRSRNEYETIDKRKSRGGYDDDSRDPEYETIPADKKAAANTNRLSSSSSSTAGILALGIHKVSHNSLEIFAEMERNASSSNSPAPPTSIPHVLVVPPTPRSASSEPGYETLPESNRRNDDPGYETVKPQAAKVSVHHRNSVSTSDYDPNYEVLRHNSTGPIVHKQQADMSYAKVWNPSSSVSDASEVSIGGLSDFHDYAKISDQNQRNFILGPADRITENEEDSFASDIYASISTVVERSLGGGTNQMHLDLTATSEPDPNYSTISETRTGTTSTLDGSATSSASGGTAKTSSSSDSSLTPIDYATMKNSTSTTTTITLDDERLTMYESLTGSESDPNYESVRYTDVDDVPTRPENPYERLYSSKTAPIAMVDDHRTTDTPEPKISVLEVGDYFQV